MYQPRRASEAPLGLPSQADAASLAAFRSAPRRAARSRLASMGGKVAPASLSLALVATVGAFALNSEQGQPDSLVAVPERSEQVSRGEEVREDLPQRAITENLATDAAAAIPTATPMAAAWSAQFGQVVGKKFTQSPVKVRTQASGEAAAVTDLGAGASVDATDVVVEGWRQVVVDKKVGWVAADALGDAAPKPKATAAKATTAAKKTTAAKTTTKAPTTYSGPSVLGLKPKAMVVYGAVTSNFKVPSVGGYRASSLSSHQCGLAIDFMVNTNSSLGNAVANYVVANAGAWGVTHIIWRQRIWTPYNPTWRGMADRGGITANHYDHVHVALADHC